MEPPQKGGCEKTAGRKFDPRFMEINREMTVYDFVKFFTLVQLSRPTRWPPYMPYLV